MSINVSCNKCSKSYRMKDEYRGKKFKCKECGSVLVVGSNSAKASRAKQPDDAAVGEGMGADSPTIQRGKEAEQSTRRFSSRRRIVCERSGQV